MNKVNLHMHTNHSLDGDVEVNDVINRCLENSISYISITDHDTCDAYMDIDLNKINNKGTLIYGMEADAIINGVTYDILCYGFDLDKVSDWAKEQYGTVETRQIKIYDKLVEDCNKLNLELDNSIPYDPKNEYAHAAIYRMLSVKEDNKSFLDKYEILNVSDFYRLSTMDKEFPLYIDMRIVWPTIDVLSKVIHDNGGKLFLAHPYKYTKGLSAEEILDSCSSFVDGIEICNEPKTKEEVEYLYEYAKKNKLLVSAGSDFHGTEKHNKLLFDIDLKMEKDILKWLDDVSGKIEF